MFAFGEVVFHAVGQLRPSRCGAAISPLRGLRAPVGRPGPLTMLRSIVAADAHALVGGELLDPA